MEIYLAPGGAEFDAFARRLQKRFPYHGQDIKAAEAVASRIYNFFEEKGTIWVKKKRTIWVKKKRQSLVDDGRENVDDIIEEHNTVNEEHDEVNEEHDEWAKYSIVTFKQ